MQNYFADALVTLAAMVLFEDGMEIPSIIIDVSFNLAYCLAIKDELDNLYGTMILSAFCKTKSTLPDQHKQIRGRYAG